MAQTTAPPSDPLADPLTPQVLGEALRSATTFHELVQNLNLKGSLGPDQHVQGPDGQYRHSMRRTAATIGAGAGAGLAIGSLAHSQKGMLIGALVGGLGGLIVDQMLKHREEAKTAAANTTNPRTDRPREFKTREEPREQNPN